MRKNALDPRTAALIPSIFGLFEFLSSVIDNTDSGRCRQRFLWLGGRTRTSLLQPRCPVKHDSEQLIVIDRLAENELVAVLGDTIHDRV